MNNELEYYISQLRNIQEEINKLDARKAELIKEGLRIEGIISYLNQKNAENSKQSNVDDKNQS